MNAGDTFFEPGDGGHLWMVLSTEAQDGTVALANLTTHDPDRRRLCSEQCIVIRRGEHPFVRHDSCVYYDDAYLAPTYWIQRGVEEGTNRLSEPLSAQLLARVRQGALDSPLTLADAKAAIRQDRQGR